jgi:hypothetical protein
MACMAKLKVMNSHCLDMSARLVKRDVAEAYDGMESGECGTDSEAAEPGFGDGTVYDSLFAEAVE